MTRRPSVFSVLPRTLLGTAIACAIVMAATGSWAADPADRTACFELQIWAADTSSCPSTGIGVRRVCEANQWFPAIGQRVQVWDKDVGADPDDYIGTWLITAAGVQCVTFPWDGMAYAGTESNPDLYIRLPVEVQRTNGAGPVLRAVYDNGSDHVGWTWRGSSDNDNWATYVNCLTGANCTLPGGPFRPTSSSTSWESVALMALDFGQRTLQVYGGALGSTEIRAELPSTDCSAGGACSFNANTIGFTTTANAKSGHNVTHELGHILQKREFDGISVLLGNCGASWGWNTPEGETCATEEGFASYVSAVSWHDPGTTGGAPEYKGNLIEDAAPLSSSCASNPSRPGQVAKAFWDLDDFNNEGASSPASVADNQNFGTTTISSYWGEFTNSTGNGGYNEPDPTGANIWDYRYRDDFAIGTAFIHHNCLQDSNDDNY